MTRVGSDPQSPPRLSVVEDDSTTEEAPPSRKRSSLGNWLLLAATLLFAWLWLHQLERTRLLADERVALQGELAAVRVEVAARAAHLERVRGEIEAVVSQVDRLKALAGNVPSAPPPPEAPGSEAVAPAPVVP